MRKRSLRTLMCALVAVLVVACGLMLTACGGQSDEEAIRQDLTAQLDEVKNADEATIQELIASEDTSSFEQMGVDPTEFITSLISGFDYSIDSITVNGDTATVSVTVTCKSLTNMEAEAQTASEELVAQMMEDPASYADISEDEIMQLLGQTVMDVVDNTATRQTTYGFTYVKSGDTWTMQDSSDEFLSTVFA